MNYIRRFIFAIIVMVLLSCAWYGAEMLIHGESQRSYVDLAIAIMISLSISGQMEKGAEISDRNREVSKQFAEKLFEHIKENQETENGEESGNEHT